MAASHAQCLFKTAILYGGWQALGLKAVFHHRTIKAFVTLRPLDGAQRLGPVDGHLSIPPSECEMDAAGEIAAERGSAF